MRAWLPDWTVCRAVIAVAALYALALQALLGGVIGVSSLDPTHRLCLQDGGPSEDQSPGKAPPVRHHLSCCTAAHVMPALDAPVFATVAIVWPVRQAVRTAWRPEITATPRAPPGISASARAPPVA